MYRLEWKDRYGAIHINYYNDYEEAYSKYKQVCGSDLLYARLMVEKLQVLNEFVPQ